MEKIAFCVITFEPIKIQTHSAPENDGLNFSFVKDIHVHGGNLACNNCKTAICQSSSFRDTLYIVQLKSTQKIKTNSDSILPHYAKYFRLLTYLIGIHCLSDFFYAFTSKNVPLTLF